MNDVLVGIAWVGGIVVVVVGAFGLGIWEMFARRKLLWKQYGDHETVALIMAQRIWVGQTREQLLNSRGPPVAVDHKLHKTNTKAVWKYDQVGKNRYNTQVTLENGEVVGFEEEG